MEKTAVEEAVSRAISGKKAGGCWALRVPDGTDARAFLDALEALEDDPSVHVTRAQAARDFRLFDVEVSDGQITDHLNRRCSCRPKT